LENKNLKILATKPLQDLFSAHHAVTFQTTLFSLLLKKRHLDAATKKTIQFDTYFYIYYRHCLMIAADGSSVQQFVDV
jgi:hypothetical protein